MSTESLSLWYGMSILLLGEWQIREEPKSSDLHIISILLFKMNSHFCVT